MKNGEINNWDVSNVTNMFHMFEGAVSFNQPLNKWNVSPSPRPCPNLRNLAATRWWRTRWATFLGATPSCRRRSLPEIFLGART